MPITLSAQKKMRQDKKRRLVNTKALEKFKKALSKTRKNLTEKNLTEATRELDLAVKKNLIHKNKAARLKSRLAKKLKNQKPPARNASSIANAGGEKPTSKSKKVKK